MLATNHIVFAVTCGSDFHAEQLQGCFARATAPLSQARGTARHSQEDAEHQHELLGGRGRQLSTVKPRSSFLFPSFPPLPLHTPTTTTTATHLTHTRTHTHCCYHSGVLVHQGATEGPSSKGIQFTSKGPPHLRQSVRARMRHTRVVQMTCR